MNTCVTLAASALRCLCECRAVLPVDLDPERAIAASTVKELLKHAQGVVPVKWDSSWAVLFFEADFEADAPWCVFACWGSIALPGSRNPTQHNFADSPWERGG